MSTRIQVLMGSRSHEFIRRHEVRQDGDAAFRQNSLTTCYNHRLRGSASPVNGDWLCLWERAIFDPLQGNERAGGRMVK